MSLLRINRRQALKLAATAPAACLAWSASAQPGSIMNQPPRIERIDLYPVRYPMTGYFKFFSDPRGSAGRAAVILRVTTDAGMVGWGQSVPIAQWSYETLETVFIALRDYYKPVLLGRDPTDIEGAHAAMDAAIAPAFSTGMPIARAGIDIALHDLTGKIRLQSLAQLLAPSPSLEESAGVRGSSPSPLPGERAGVRGPDTPPRRTLTLSWTVNVTRLEDVPTVMEAGRSRGYRHFNIKVAPNPDFDVALAKAVRHLAPDCFLWADANCGYDPETALAAAPRLADAGVDVLEAPIRPNRIRGYQALKKQGALPILMDEGVVSPVELEEFIHLEMLDGMAMKPARCGGLLSNRRQIELCLEHNLIWLGSGLTDPDISLAAMVGLYAAYNLEKPAALNGPQFLTADVLEQPLRVENGQIHVPDGPGLGIAVSEEKVIELMKRSGGDQLLRLSS
jgi:L-alanine-DL-glutamate epimerase-like enolase superfamily enzyme